MKYSLQILSLSILAAGPAYAQSTGPITTERLTITGPGSTGDVSGMSVSPDAAAAGGTLSKLIADKAPLNAPSFTGPAKVAGQLAVSGNTGPGDETLVLDVLGKGRIFGLFEATVDMIPPRDSYTQHTLYSVNRGPRTASGTGQTYISYATNPGFDVAHQITGDFRVTSSENAQSKLGQFFQVGSPPMPSGIVGAAVAEWNLTNRGADTGYQASISSPNTYNGTVPLQQVGGLNLVPEANFNSILGVGTNVTYGVMVSPSSNSSPRLGNDFPRTYAGFGTDRNALVPTATGIGGEGGRGFSFYGGTSAALAPSAVGQAWGFWTHGLDLSRAAFAANDPIRVKAGQEVVWEDGTGTKVAGLTVTPAGVPRIIDASGNATDLTRGAWTVYTPTYTPSPAAGVTVTNNRASYEIVGKTLRMQVQFQLSWTGSAPGSIQMSLPPGVTLKHAAAGSLANISAGIGGYALGQQGASAIIVGNTTAFGGSSSFLTMSFTAEIN